MIDGDVARAKILERIEAHDEWFRNAEHKDALTYNAYQNKVAECQWLLTQLNAMAESR